MNIKLTNEVCQSLKLNRDDIKDGIEGGAIKGLIEPSPSRTVWIDDSELRTEDAGVRMGDEDIKQKLDDIKASVLETNRVMAQIKAEVMAELFSIRVDINKTPTRLPEAVEAVKVIRAPEIKHGQSTDDILQAIKESVLSQSHG